MDAKPTVIVKGSFIASPAMYQTRNGLSVIAKNVLRFILLEDDDGAFSIAVTGGSGSRMAW